MSRYNNQSFASRPEEVVGRVATSRAGRDAGTVYLIVGTAGRQAVLVADGRRRGVANPKRKNLKHLRLGPPVPGVADRLASGQALRDEEVREALRGMEAAGE
jgi:hypothetical protein